MTHSSQFNRFENKVSRLFDDFLSDVGLARNHGKFRGISTNSDGKPTWTPAIDIMENESEYNITADVPGVKKEDIDVEFHDSVLVISGHHRQDSSSNESTGRAQEINIDKNDQHRQQQSTEPQKYQQVQEPQPQQYQQSTEKYPQPQYHQQPPQQYQQQPPQPQQQSQQPQQQSQQPQQPQQQQSQQPQQQQSQQQQPQQQQYQQQPQQSTEAQKYQQSVDQKYNLSNEQQQQSNEPQEFQHVKRRHHQDTFKGEKFHIQERPYGYFSRSIQLPSNIKADDEFYASLENGVLTIRVPKNNEKPKKKITIF